MTPGDPLGDRDLTMVARLAERTVVLLEREYPNGIRLTLTRPPTGLITPRAIHPAFYGCYDWHSSVHSHWQVVRALRLVPDAPFVRSAARALDRTLSPAAIAVEMDWLEERPGFEMPYGMAWLLRLQRELHDWNRGDGDDRGARWAAALEPLADHATARFEAYCRTRTAPVRGGLHDQTAFSLGLALDSLDPDDPLVELVDDAADRFYAADTSIDMRHEPSATDFLSPALCEADLMRRVLPGSEFTAWLERFAPDGFDVLRPVDVVDPSHGQLAHWAGLDISRSWMMSAVADALPDDHRLVGPLRANAAAHAELGLMLATHDDYMISHWVPTFAVYLLTETWSAS